MSKAERIFYAMRERHYLNDENDVEKIYIIEKDRESISLRYNELKKKTSFCEADKTASIEFIQKIMEEEDVTICN